MEQNLKPLNCSRIIVEDLIQGVSKKNWVLSNLAIGDPAASWGEIFVILVANPHMLNSVKLSFFWDTLYLCGYWKFIRTLCHHEPHVFVIKIRVWWHEIICSHRGNDWLEYIEVDIKTETTTFDLESPNLVCFSGFGLNCGHNNSKKVLSTQSR